MRLPFLRSSELIQVLVLVEHTSRGVRMPNHNLAVLDEELYPVAGGQAQLPSEFERKGDPAPNVERTQVNRAHLDQIGVRRLRL
jgi:hypothetical protein